MALRDEVRAGILSSKDENVVSSNFAWFQIFIGSIGAGLYFQSWGIGLLSIVVFGFVLILFAKIFVWLVGLAVFGFVWWVNGF